MTAKLIEISADQMAALSEVTAHILLMVSKAANDMDLIDQVIVSVLEAAKRVILIHADLCGCHDCAGGINDLAEELADSIALKSQYDA